MAKIASLIAAIAAAVILGGMQHETEAQTSGWTCLPGFGHCTDYGDGHNPTVNATVGLPFELPFLAGCNTGQWTYGSVEIQTGRLPPGLDFDNSTFNIVGVPTRAGSFSFRILFRGIYCPGGDYFNGDHAANYTIVATGN
ncbi:MAG: putative Ig domain-containing protein [Dongiaceae bacterium]